MSLAARFASISGIREQSAQEMRRASKPLRTVGALLARRTPACSGKNQSHDVHRLEIPDCFGGGCWFDHPERIQFFSAWRVRHAQVDLTRTARGLLKLGTHSGPEAARGGVLSK